MYSARGRAEARGRERRRERGALAAARREGVDERAVEVVQRHHGQQDAVRRARARRLRVGPADPARDEDRAFLHDPADPRGDERPPRFARAAAVAAVRRLDAADVQQEKRADHRSR